MFRKIKCGNCGEKTDEKHNFCPYCKNPLKSHSEEDWGMLGKNDLDLDNIKMPMGFNTLFNSLLKNLNNEFVKMDEDLRKSEIRPMKNNVKKSGISINISTAHGKPPQIKIKSFGDQPQNMEKQETIKPISKNFAQKEFKEFSKLPKKEPLTNIRRFSDKVIYEIKIPGVKSMEDISINQFENSIEIKAISKGKAYSKIIPINLPIKSYNLSKGILVLELDSRD